MDNKALRVIISGGGTGGHIYPAIAIANELKARNKDTAILFVGAHDRMEMEKVPKAGYKIEGLWISGIQRKLSLKNLMFPIKLIQSLLKASSIIKHFNPDVVIGVGGYASDPTLYADVKKKVPALVQEQNSYAGITNKLLAKKVQRVCVAYDKMERYFPKEVIVHTGNPVRKDISKLDESIRAKAFSYFGLDANKKTILVICGSLGALSINESISNHIDQLIDSGYQLIWQTGKYFFPKAKEVLKDKSQAVIFCSEFIYEMDMAYAAADVVLSRAGALSISELCIVGRPVILVPYPYAAEDHQTKNAKALVDKAAAIMISDKDARTALIPALFDLLKDEAKQSALKENIKVMGICDADIRIVDEVYKLVD